MWRLALSLVIALTGPVAAQTDADLSAAADRVITALRAGDTAQAVIAAEAGVTLARQSTAASPQAIAWALNNLGHVLTQANREPARAAALFDEAIGLLETRGLVASAAGLTALYNRARLAASQGDTALARTLTDKAVTLAKGTAFEAHVAASAADLHLGAGRYTEAALAISNAIDQDPDVLRPMFGDLFVRLAQHIEAEEEDTNWTALAPLYEAKLAILRAYYFEADRDQAMRTQMFSRYFALYQTGEYARARAQIRVWLNTGTLSQEEQAFVDQMVEIAKPFAEGANINSFERLETARSAVMFAGAIEDVADPRLGLALRTIASAEGYMGQNAQAAATLELAIEILSASEEGQRHLPAIYDDLGWNAVVRNDPARARALFAEADKARAGVTESALETAQDRAWRLANRARFALDSGDTAGAIAAIDAARAALGPEPDGGDWLWALTSVRLETNAIWTTYVAGDPIDLAPLLSRLDRLRDLAPEDSPDFTMALANAADTALAALQPDVARALLDEAVSLNDTALPEIAPQALATRILRAQLEIAFGDRALAEQEYRQVIAARKSPAYHDNLAQASTEFEHFAWLLIDRPDRSRAHLAEAFETLQWTQITQSAEALGFLETRLSVDDPSRGKLLRERQQLQESFAQLGDRLTRDVPQGVERAAMRRETRAELQDVSNRLALVDTSLDALGLETIGVGRVKPVALDEVKALLEPGEMLVTFLLPSLNPAYIKGLDASSNHVIGVTRDAVHVARMGEVSRRVLRERIQAFRCDVAISDPGCRNGGASGLRGAMSADRSEARKDMRAFFDFDRAYALYRDLFGGLAEELVKADHVIIAPPPDMLRLPFQALVTQAGRPDSLGQAPWMIRQNAVSVLPSIAAFGTLRARGGSGALNTMAGFGDPVIGAPVPAQNCGPQQFAALRAAPATGARFSQDRATGVRLADTGFLRALDRLPDTVCELQAIGNGFAPSARSLVLGEAATETRVKAMNAQGDLENFDVLVFATHGLTAGEAGAAEPGLVLTPPDRASVEDDGLLTAAEIAMLALKARIVVLSACNTAAGDDAGADGLSGLARAFFQAGAESLLVTHWSVYSQAAVDVSTGFFADLRADPAQRLGSALRRSTLRILDDARRPAAQHHPAYWAAFSIIGA